MCGAMNIRKTKEPIAFLLVVEAGLLERQAVLLAESIRRFGGSCSGCRIWATQPRHGKSVSPATLESLAELEVTFLRANLNAKANQNTKCNHRLLGFLNKTYTAAFFEEILEHQVQSLVFLDSDTLVLREPRELHLDDTSAVAVRPVDTRNVGCPAGRPLNTFWTKMFAASGTSDKDIWNVVTTTDRKRVKAYFNAGLVAVRPERQIFRRWRATVEAFWPHVFDRRVCSTRAHVSLAEQCALSATILGCVDRKQVRILSGAYNYPLHKQKRLRGGQRKDSLADISILHYHSAFNSDAWREGIMVSPEYERFLARHLPFSAVTNELPNSCQNHARRASIPLEEQSNREGRFHD